MEATGIETLDDLDALLAKIDASTDGKELEEYLWEYYDAERGFGEWDTFYNFGLQRGFEDHRRILRHPTLGRVHLEMLLEHLSDIPSYEEQFHEEERAFSSHADQLLLQQMVIDVLTDPRWDPDALFDDRTGHYRRGSFPDATWAEWVIWSAGNQWRAHESHANWFHCGIVLGSLCNPTLSGKLIQKLYDGTDGELFLRMDYNVLGRDIVDLVAAHPNTPTDVLDGLIDNADGMFNIAAIRPILLARDDLTAEQVARLRAAPSWDD